VCDLASSSQQTVIGGSTPSKLIDLSQRSNTNGRNPILVRDRQSIDAVAIAVHIGKGETIRNRHNSVQMLAIDRLFNASHCAQHGSKKVELFHPLVIYEDHGIALDKVVDVVFGGNKKCEPNLVKASRKVERQHMGSGSYDVFSGIYGASVKSRALRWIAESTHYNRMWILEGDIVWTGSAWVCTFWLINPTWRWKVTNVCAYGGDCLWQDEFFNEYADDSADLIAINTTLKNGLDWPHFASCTLCDDKEGTLAARKTAFLPVFRISKRLARAVLEGLGSSTLTGHHEVYISTICARIKGCRWRVIESSQHCRFRPEITLKNLRQGIIKSRLYHPVKSSDVFSQLLQFASSA